MTYELIYNDLIEVSTGRDRPGIYWLRLYSSNNYIAIVTEVPGNPSLSVGNGIENIASYICSRYKIESSDLMLYQVWPDRIDSNYKSKGSIKKVILGNFPVWIDLSRREIEVSIGIELIELPTHDELYLKVLKLGGGVIEEDWKHVFEAVLVSELPFPHNPSRCKYSERFNNLAKQIESHNSISDLEFETGKVFLESITANDLDTCPYHQGNWKVIADESVRIIETLGRCEDKEHTAAANKSVIPERDRMWLISLFDDPVFIGGDSYTNGQHRGCALRFSGANRAAVVTGDYLIGERCVDWMYGGNG